MSGILPLQYRPTPNVGTVYDPTVQINAADQQLQLKQQQDAVERQNALMGIFRDPKSLDGTGNPTPETMQKIMAVDPQVGMTVRQNMLIGQQRQLQTDALKSNLMEKKMDMIGEATAPIMETYETDVKSGVPEPQARRNAQAALVQANQRLMDSGIFGEDDKKRFPTEFDPIQMRNVVAGTKQYQDWVKQQRADAEEARKQRHDDEQNTNKGTELLQDNTGRPFTWRPNAPQGKKAVYADDSPVPEEKLQGVSKVSSGGGAGGSPAAQDRRDIEFTERNKYERELGHPVTSADEQAELKNRILKAETDRKAAQAGATTGARLAAGGGSAGTQDRAAITNVVRTNYETELGRPVNLDDPKEKAELDRRVLAAEDARTTQRAADKQAAVAKTAEITVDGKPQQGIWKYGQWFEPDGKTPITSPVRMTASVRADQSLADREKLAAERADTGVPQTPDQKAAAAAQVASGEPMTQIIPGWGPASRKAQQEARNDAIQLIRDQTGMDALDAGLELANRGIEYASGKKAQGVQQTMLSTTRTAVKQLDYNIDKVKEELTRLKSTNISPVINALLRKEEEWTGDPNLSSLFYSMSAVGMESARILSGGSASIQQLHEGAANEARKWANIGMTPASFEAVARTISDEGKARLKAWEEGIKEGRIGGPPKTGNTAPGAAAQPQQADIDFLKANPDKAARFDKTFGEGAARRILQPASAPAGAPTQPAPTQPGFGPLKPVPGAPTVAPPAAPKPAEGVPVPEQYANLPDGKTFTSKSTGQKFVKRNGKIYPVEGGNDQALNRAREAIRLGAPRDAVIKRLQDAGIDTKGL